MTNRPSYVGIDLGTSSVRALLVDRSGAPLAQAARSYPISAPDEGFAEQDVDGWWRATAAVVRAVSSHPAASALCGIGVTGQMHGTVVIDGAGRAIRPAIIWPDRRTAADVDELRRRVDPWRLRRLAGMPITAGLQGPTMAWLRRNEPRDHARVRSVLTPKDYLRYRLTGRIASERTDASGTLLFDIEKGDWSAELAELFGVDRDLLPPIAPSGSRAGELTRSASADLGLPEGIPVSIGVSDQAAAALSLGLDDPRRMAVGISSGGTVLRSTVTPGDHDLGSGAFLQAGPNDDWLRVGGIISGGLALEWVAKLLTSSGSCDLDQLTAVIDTTPPGADGALFLPYLRGENTPLFSPLATASFRGIRVHHSRAHLIRAVMEGVIFALKDCVEAVGSVEAGTEIVAFGGGLRNDRWRQILADVIGRPVMTSGPREHSAYGAVILGARCVGETLPATPLDPTMTLQPRQGSIRVYEDRYEEYAAARSEFDGSRILEDNP